MKFTSMHIFHNISSSTVMLLLLYLLQMINWSIYSYSKKRFNDTDDGALSLSEILVPMSLSLVLCFIHSQIVATTASSSRTSSKRRRGGKSTLSICANSSDKINRRKKKPSRLRPTLESVEALDSDEERRHVLNRRKPTLKFPLEDHESRLDAPSTSSRRRNVNWESPVRNFNDQVNIRRRRTSDSVQNGDDGFESFTGKSSSGEDNLRERQLSPKETDSDVETPRNSERSTPVKKCVKKLKDSSDTDEENNEEVESPSPTPSSPHFETTDCEYEIRNTSNSESECSVHSGCECENEELVSPTNILNPHDSKEKVSCTIWTKNEAKKAELSVLDISVEIIKRVESLPETCDYVYIGVILSVILSLIPSYCRLCDVLIQESNSTTTSSILEEFPKVLNDDSTFYQTFMTFSDMAFGETSWEKTFLIISTIQRLFLSFFFFFLMAVAERTFKER